MFGCDAKFLYSSSQGHLYFQLIPSLDAKGPLCYRQSQNMWMRDAFSLVILEYRHSNHFYEIALLHSLS